MSQEDFTEAISHNIFGIASKDYYVSKLNREIEELKEIPDEIEYYLTLWKEDRKMFEFSIKRSFKGSVKRTKEAFSKTSSKYF